jgi:hypothetical protein
MAFDEAFAALTDGRIKSGPAVIALQWLALNRKSLVSAPSGASA